MTSVLLTLARFGSRSSRVSVGAQSVTSLHHIKPLNRFCTLAPRHSTNSRELLFCLFIFCKQQQQLHTVIETRNLSRTRDSCANLTACLPPSATVLGALRLTFKSFLQGSLVLVIFFLLLYSTDNCRYADALQERSAHFNVVLIRSRKITSLPDRQ